MFLLKSLLPIILDWLLGRALKALKGYLDKKRGETRTKAIEDLKTAKTEQETQHALDTLRDNLP